MSMPSEELMKLVAGGSGTNAIPQPPGPPGAPPSSPVSSPMTTPEQKEGEKANAKIQVQMAMDLLEQTLPALGSETPEGKSILSALSGLSKTFGESQNKSKELVPAEIMQLMQSLPQAGGGSPEMKAMQGAGGPPGGMPPGAGPMAGAGGPAGMPPMPGA